jgi:hypothetical protein
MPDYTEVFVCKCRTLNIIHLRAVGNIQIIYSHLFALVYNFIPTCFG